MQDKIIDKEALVPGPIDDVWRAWTTAEGVRAWFAPDARIEMRYMGPYEILFDEEAPEGSRGSEGCCVLAFLPRELLVVSWNAPPHLAEARKQRAWIVVQFEARGEAATRVRIRHYGFLEGEEWNLTYEYFVRAWDVVMRRLVNRFAEGPVDWSKV